MNDVKDASDAKKVFLVLKKRYTKIAILIPFDIDQSFDCKIYNLIQFNAKQFNAK